VNNSSSWKAPARNASPARIAAQSAAGGRSDGGRGSPEGGY